MKKVKRIVMSDTDKELLSDINIIGSEIIIEGKTYFPKKCISKSGYKSVVWEGKDFYSEPVILKFAIYEDYKDRSFLDELQKTSILNKYSEFAKIFGADIKEFGKNTKVKCVVFVEQYIEGTSLDKIDNDQITLSFIINFIEQMCEILNILRICNLRHDDLHSGNIRISPPLPGTFKYEYRVIIIDMGSLKHYDEPLKESKKGIDDLGNFCKHIELLANKMLFDSNGRRKYLSNDQRYFRDEIIKILSLIIEEDKQRALSDFKQISNQFYTSYNKINYPQLNETIKLDDPFDYISAEHISNDNLLIKLFAESCPWIKDVSGPNPILLSGPRGCGKSMLFRRLSLKVVLLKGKQAIIDTELAGFYVSCSAELSSRFSIITTKPQANQFKNEIIHYFNLLLVKEIIHTLQRISNSEYSETLFGFGKKEESAIYNFITNALNISDERKLKLQGSKPLEHLYEIINYDLNYCYEMILKRKNITSYTSFGFLADVSKFITGKIIYFKNKIFTFLIDDFSVHKISEPVQELLSQIIWDRQSTHIFKVSSEKLGAERIMQNKASADPGREFREIDLGRMYINLSDKKRDLKRFASELLNHRMKLTGYKGNAAILIGNSAYKSKTLGKSIRNKTDENEYYHGLDTISQICSGDIYALLEVYRNIFKIGKVDANYITQIPKHTQHKAITTISKEFYELIKTFHPYGNEMHSIVNHFGILCRKILTEGKQQVDAKGINIPNETTRIEVEQVPGKEEWTDYLYDITRELIRRAIFIELEDSRGRHTLGPTTRWQLRRIYCPTFLTALMKNTAIKWNESEFKYFITSPKDKCKIEFDARWKLPDKNENQNSLFKDEN